MGTLTLEDFRAQLVIDMKNRNDAAFTTDRQDRWINYAYNQISHPTVFRHRQLMANATVTLATDVNEYTIDPAVTGTFQWNVLKSVFHMAATSYSATGRKRRLRPATNVYFDESTLVSGVPHTYSVMALGDSVSGEIIKIASVPRSNENGQILILRGWREPAVLTAGNATVLPLFWDEVISLGAKWRAERDLGYAGQAELTKQDMASLINELTDRDDTETREEQEWEVEILGTDEPIMEVSA